MSWILYIWPSVGCLQAHTFSASKSFFLMLTRGSASGPHLGLHPTDLHYRLTQRACLVLSRPTFHFFPTPVLAGMARLSWPRWLIAYKDGLQAHRSLWVLTEPDTEKTLIKTSMLLQSQTAIFVKKNSRNVVFTCSTEMYSPNCMQPTSKIYLPGPNGYNQTHTKNRSLTSVRTSGRTWLSNFNQIKPHFYGFHWMWQMASTKKHMLKRKKPRRYCAHTHRKH